MSDDADVVHLADLRYEVDRVAVQFSMVCADRDGYRAERDRLQAALWEGQKYRAELAGRASRLEAENERLRAIVERDDLYSMLDLLEANQRLRAVVDAVTAAVDECRRERDMPGSFARLFYKLAALDVSPATGDPILPGAALAQMVDDIERGEP